MGWFKWVPVVGQIAQGIAWAVTTIKDRRKNGKLTEAQRAQIDAETNARLDRIIREAEKAKGK